MPHEFFDQTGVNDIGRYVSFCKEDGSPLNWLQPVKNLMPNGLLDQKRKA